MGRVVVTGRTFFCPLLLFQISNPIRLHVSAQLVVCTLHCPSSISRLVLLGILGRRMQALGLVLVLCCPCHYCHFLTYHLASLCISDVTLWYRFSQSHRCANDWGFSLRWNWVYLSTVSILIGSVLHTATRTCQGGLDAMHQCEKTSQPHVTLPFFQMLVLLST